jgi:hypothetical protein
MRSYRGPGRCPTHLKGQAKRPGPPGRPGVLERPVEWLARQCRRSSRVQIRDVLGAVRLGRNRHELSGVFS